MILYLCRHASAEDAGAGQSDGERALTPEGVKKFRLAARGFLSLEPDVSHVLTSPLVRARQTAELLSEAFDARKHRVQRVVCTPLGAAASLREFLREIAAMECRDVVAVGHEPTLSHWLGELCFGHAGRAEFKKGAIAAIDMQRGRGQLLWLMQPGQLRALG